MKPKHWYLGLALLGTILPYSQFVPFVREHGLDLGLFWAQLFANRISAFFALDVFVSSVVLWVFVLWEGRRNRVKHLWAPILGSLTVGVSLGLPLFLYIRERQLESRVEGRPTA
jgi:Terpene cyclase DEP1